MPNLKDIKSRISSVQNTKKITKAMKMVAAAKVKKAESEKPELENEFKQLREITDNYTVPGDVCESYEAVYNMLSEVDKAYHA